MSSNKKAGLLLLIICFVLCFHFCRKGVKIKEMANMILINGNIITVDPENPKAEAVAIKEDKILAVGSNEDIMAYERKETRIIDLEGKTAVPGLIDAHLHFPLLGKRLSQLYLDETESFEEVIDLLADAVKKVEPGEWIRGSGWHTASWEKKDYPENSKLNEISRGNPVFLEGMASHAALVNKKALEIAGITRETPDPPGGRILRNPGTQEPTGVLLEKAQELVKKSLPPETYEAKKRDIKLSNQTALSLGLTGVHDPGVGYDIIKIYKELLAEGELDIRLYVMFFVPDGGQILDKYIKNPPEIGLGNNRLTLRSIKAFADGALGARGAALLKPYADSPEENGLLMNSKQEIDKIIFKSTEANYQVALHAIGDRGNRIVLDAIDKTQKALASKDSRIRIEHAQILSPEDLPRFAQLGVIPSMQPIHCPMDMSFAEARIGALRMKGAYAWQSLLDTGARIAGGSDVPAFPVDFSNPLRGIHAAITRQDKQGHPAGGWYSEQKVSRLEALKMFTINAAYAAFEEKIKGSLTPGKLADITILSKDILTIPEKEILSADVLMTLVGGKILYQKK